MKRKCLFREQLYKISQDWEKKVRLRQITECKRDACQKLLKIQLNDRIFHVRA
jgi:hypothetical protein